MPGLRSKTLALLAIFGLLLAGLAACAPVETNAGAPQSINPTVVVVQYVTQVVAPTTPAPVVPTATGIPPTVKPPRTGYDPYSVQPYFPLLGCSIASRLHVGDRAVVGDTRSGTLGLHMSANIGDAPLFRKVNNGEILDVIGGPFCRTQSIVWEVMIGEEERGFIAEGDGNSYWLLPLGEQVDKDTLKAVKKEKALRVRLGNPADCLPR